MSNGRAVTPSPLVGEGREGGTGTEGETELSGDPRPDTPLSNSPPQGGRGQDGAPPHLSGALDHGTHRLPVRVYYEDTDWSGVVYHASYLRFMERGRTDFLRLAGVDQSTLHAQGEGIVFAVRRMTIDYLKPARMDDVLTVETRTEEVRGASLVIAQRVLRGDEVLVTADVRVAALANGRPARIPDDLRRVLGGTP